jgi:hypothetical protein
MNMEDFWEIVADKRVQAVPRAGKIARELRVYVRLERRLVAYPESDHFQKHLQREDGKNSPVRVHRHGDDPVGVVAVSACQISGSSEPYCV